MAKTSSTQISIQVTGDGLSEVFNPPAIVNQAAPGGGPIATALASGDNTIPVPPGAVAALITPPTASAVAKKLKGVGGDTGFSISPNTPTMVSFPSPAPASMLLNAAGIETVSIQWL